jgi:SM-20-related protein
LRVLILDSIAAALATEGWSVVTGFVPPDLLRELADEAVALLRTGALRQAGIGSGQGARLDPAVRGDRTLWLEPSTATRAQRDCLDALEALRLTLNRELQLGLFDFEGHFAVYPTGSVYRRHRDQQVGASARVLSCVLYLNHAWNAEHGGHLRLYPEPSDAEIYRDVLPEGGTLVCFLSERFWHEVLPATRLRISLTGWFRRRAAL